MFVSWISSFLKLFWALLGRRSSSNLSPLGPGSTASSSSKFSNSFQNYRHDVFINFRGVDTRNTFVDHLYAHFIRKGIFVFKDDKKLQKGKSTLPQLIKAITESRVSIIIFSKDYAASTWCLDEMAAIADCQQHLKQIVYPIFYDVDPSDVRYQNGVYEDAFVSHRRKFKHDPDKVHRWERAMTGLASSVGWDVRNKPEFEEIEKIVQAVIKILGHKFSGFADDLIGMQPRVQTLESILKLSSEKDDIRVLGIWGMGGIGKTTHVTVLYDKISYKFDACCFIENVSKIYKDGGIVAIQKQILRQTLDEKNLEISPSEISGMVKYRLHNIKVLIVLDNVDQLEQLQELAINPKLLFLGSRMIVTTRDKHILNVYGANVIHEISLLNDNDARELFYKKAFKNEDQSSSCVELIPEVLKYAQCLPLAIRVVGSFLCTRDATQWRDALDRLENNPHNKVMNVLQISVDGLQYEEREIFIHIACFFKGEREDYVKRILDCCGLYPHIGISRIIEKSLITIRDQEIHMHEMLQELGKKIVRDQHPDEPGLWSRLWLYQDFFHVLMTETGTDNVKAIVVDQKEDDSESECRVDGLSKMKNLRLLILYHKKFSGSLNFLSQKLRYLMWHGYPFPSLPSFFTAFGLVELNMPDSNIERVWEGCKNFPCLKRMDLSNSKYLIEGPNFSGVPKLERLDLSGCTDLLQLHPSIGLLEKLAFLSLRNCSNLESVNFGSVSNLCSLRVLHLSGCTKLENTPDFASAINLEYLDIDGCTSLSMVHESIGALAKLTFLSLRECKNLVNVTNNIDTMISLKTLDLYGCLKLMNLPLGQTFNSSSHLEFLIFLDIGFCSLLEVPDAIGELRCLERLNLEGNNFVSLPYSIKGLHCLAYLNLSHCHELNVLPELPSSSASSVGRYFKTVSGSHDHRSGLYVFDCPKVANMLSKNWNWMSPCKDLELIWLVRLIEEPFHFRCGFDIVVPWGWKNIPRWFDKGFKGGSVIRIKHFNMVDNWIGFTFCVVFEKIAAITLGPKSTFLTIGWSQRKMKLRILKQRQKKIISPMLGFKYSTRNMEAHNHLFLTQAKSHRLM
ncbi:TMV resistance protein N-like [Abrus precatorius]|uniref:TMV resistance protein N-like n=1 Tax=Abrus precatorius TaxID=3816 RepID=A0A8B8K9I3_ABRPR|nr:TMV resistance protein N-like [Abrus precatorius]